MIPQEIIHTIVGNIDVENKSLLRTCTLVSRSFLYSSRKQLFASISLDSDTGKTQYCQGLLDFLVQHPYIQSYVKRLKISYSESNLEFETLLAVLHPLLPSLSTFAFSSVQGYSTSSNWNRLSGTLRDTLFDVIHSPSLTSLTLDHITHVPNDLFLGLKGVRTLRLDDVHLVDVDNEHGVSQSVDFNEVQKPQSSVDHDRAPIERFTWRLDSSSLYFTLPPMVGYLPFLMHPRFVRFSHPSSSPSDSYLVSHFLEALSSTLQPPATLEHLELSCLIEDQDDLNMHNFWTDLDSVATDPLYAHLHRVDVIIWRCEDYNNHEDLQTIVPRLLPLLSSKGILHVLVH